MMVTAQHLTHKHSMHPYSIRNLSLYIGDLFAVIVVSALICLAFPNIALAYVDPSVMTYTIQAVAGVAVALSTVIGVAWRRARKKIYSKLNIDEDKNKLSEPKVTRIEPFEKHEVDLKATKTGSFGQMARQDPDVRHKPDSWKKKLLPTVLISTFATATLLLVAPYELVAANSSSLLFGLNDIWLPVLIGAVLVDVILICIMMLFKGRAYKIVCAFVTAFGVSCYLQALVANFTLPAANGFYIDFSGYTTETIVSALLWVAVFCIALVFCVKSSWKAQKIFPLIAAAMIFIQGVGVASLFVGASTNALDGGAGKRSQSDLVVTTKGLNELAPANNVVVFVLDMTDTDNVSHLIQDHPDYFENFTDFTFFNDVTGAMIPTRYGAGFLYTGELPKYGERFKKYWDERFDRSTFIEDIYDQNYTIGMYTDSLYNGTEHIAGFTENIHPIKGDLTITTPVEVVEVLWKCSFFRDMPWLIKPLFWFYTDEINNSAVFTGDAGEGLPYHFNDPQYYKNLKDEKLKIVDDGSKGDFRFIHLLGSHWPMIMDENAELVGLNNSDLDRQTLGSFRIVDEYISQMKELGVYDNSTIIVTSDHGYFDCGYDLDELERPTSPIMFVKPSNPENPGKPMEISDVPITHGSFHPTVIEAVGGNYSKYGTPALSQEDNDEPRYYYFTMHDGYTDHYILEYEITGPVSDFNNWHLTGKRWNVNMHSWE